MAEQINTRKVEKIAAGQNIIESLRRQYKKNEADRLRSLFNRQKFIENLYFGTSPSISDNEKKLYNIICEYKKNKWLEITEGKGLLKFFTTTNYYVRFTNDFFTALNRNNVDDYENFLFKNESVDKALLNAGGFSVSEEDVKIIINELINCDYNRINLSPYEESRLTDPNGGYWDLWKTKDEGGISVKLDKPFYGRNPLTDVKTDGIVGIDFGTKSTIVTFQNGTDNISPMRIGYGELKNAVTSKDYENPTVMEFIDLDRFLSRYNSKEYRPETEWADLTVSHTAVENLNNSESASEYYAWFSDLKQWASDKKRKIIIKDKKGKEVELSSFTDINGDDLNPIELYAYLLGLFINNMYNGIYLNYILSFPVTYERKIRQKITESFYNGLKKSLPEEIFEDKDISSLFRVIEGASEPTAYAVCALKEYGFNPDNDEKILYGVFDFGGGTTDFDFGIWQRASSKLQRRYDYVINHFGAGGDRYLGGENILELLAYSVFKNNEEVLRQNDIQFIKPHDADKYCGKFDGSESLITDSQQAKNNQKKLAEKLRPLWHGEEYNEDKITVQLYNNKGETVEQELLINTDELKNLICTRIENGVENFFHAMNMAFSDELKNESEKIHIFLAGNSSKSVFVKQAFEKIICKYKSDCTDENIEDLYEKSKCLCKKLDCLRAESDCLRAESEELRNESEELRNESEILFNESVKLNEAIKNSELLFPSETSENYHAMLKKSRVILDLREKLNRLRTESEKKLAESEKKLAKSDELRAELEKKLAESDELRAKLERLRASYEEKKNNENRIIVYPPLGTREADEIRKKKGIDISESVTRPTGKTGVAYGLLECRPGSRIKVESEIKETDEIKFNFYIGYSGFGKFNVVIDRDIEYKKWVEFIDAGESDFELYYTSLPEAAGNEMSVNGISKKICRIDEVVDDAMVYIRVTEPDVIEYVVSYEEDLEKGDYITDIKSVKLD